jgi:L-lactate permease
MIRVGQILRLIQLIIPFVVMSIFTGRRTSLPTRIEGSLSFSIRIWSAVLVICEKSPDVSPPPLRAVICEVLLGATRPRLHSSQFTARSNNTTKLRRLSSSTYDSTDIAI